MDDKKLKAEMVRIGNTNDAVALAKLVGEPFDPENPVFHPVIEAVFKTDTVGVGEDYDYFIADQEVHKVTTIVNGSLTQVDVTPLTEQTATFSYRSSEEKIVYLEKLMEAKYDTIAKIRIGIMESLNRIELKDAIACIDGAALTANQLTVASGAGLTFSDLVDSAFALFDYADVSTDVDGNIRTNLVLITGANITRDLMTLDVDADLNRALTVRRAGLGAWYAIGKQTVSLDGAAQVAVIDPDVAYIVAPNKQDGRETGHFVRRRVRDVVGDGEVAEKERLVKAFGPRLQQGANPKWAFSLVGMCAYTCVIVNSKAIVKLTK